MVKKRLPAVLLVTLAIATLIPLASQPAAAHGTCTATALQPKKVGDIAGHLYGTGTYNCTDGNAKMTIKVELQFRLGVDVYARATTTNTKIQAMNISATSDYGCGINPGPPIAAWWRTHIVYARGINSSGVIVHEATHVYSNFVPILDCLP